MQAVILAGGVGTRLQPVIGNDQQKTMYQYSDKPLLHRTIEILRDKGIKNIVLVVSYQKEKVMAYFGDGRKFGVRVEYVFQKYPKGGTADAVRYAKEKVNGEKFLLVYGDNVFHENAIDKLLEKGKEFPGVLCGKEGADPSKFGVLQVDGSAVEKIIEKPEVPPSNLLLTGLFVLPKEIFSAIEQTDLSPRGEYELTDSIQILIDKGYKFGYTTAENFWLDPRDKKVIEKA